jgi:hypothetical protein
MIGPQKLNRLLMKTADANPGQLKPLHARDTHQHLRHLLEQHPLIARRSRPLRCKYAHLARCYYRRQRIRPALAAVLNHVRSTRKRQISTDH